MLLASSGGDTAQLVLTIVAVVSALTAVYKGRSDKDTADKSDWREGTKNLIAAVQGDAKTAREIAAAAEAKANACEGRCDELSAENGLLRARVAHLETENDQLRAEVDHLKGNNS